MDVAERVREAGPQLTGAERLVAEVVVGRPQLVAFGTVAELAEAAGTGSATVVRLAAKLGFDGFTALQSSIRTELAHQLRPAAERIREARPGDVVGEHLEAEVANVRTTLQHIERRTLDAIVALLAAPRSRVLVLSGEASRGVATQFVIDLSSLRDEVDLLDGNDVAVRRRLALLRPEDVVVALDLRRYERWVVDAARAAAAVPATVVAVTDSVLSPLAASAAHTIVVAAAGAGPFDSHVGTLAAFNLIAAALADTRRAEAAARLDRLEAGWRDALTD